MYGRRVRVWEAGEETSQGRHPGKEISPILEYSFLRGGLPLPHSEYLPKWKYLLPASLEGEVYVCSSIHPGKKCTSPGGIFTS